MKPAQLRLFKRFDRAQVEREIDEELRFHLELLTQEQLQRGMPLADARNAAIERFGNVAQIKEQCVEISRSSRPSIRALKSFLILAFLAGVLVRVFGTEYHVLHVGDTLIAVGILGRLLVYVRSLNPSSFRTTETASPLMLCDQSQTSITPYDHRKRTPVERVISDK